MPDFRVAFRNQRLSETRSHQVLARAASVAEHHYDTNNPDKPLWMMIPGGLVAFVALLATLWTGYQYWVAIPPMADDVAVPELLVCLAIYFTALFLFSYGYELYDLKKAVRLTIIIGLIGLAAVFILLALGALLKGGSSKSSRSSQGSSSGSGSGSDFAGGSSSGGSFSFPRLNLNLGHSYRSGTGTGLGLSSPVATGCVFCTRPLPPGGKLPVPAGVDPSLFCPKCGQAFEAAGENAKAAVTH